MNHKRGFYLTHASNCRKVSIEIFRKIGKEMAELKKTEEVTRTLKIYLNDKLEMDSNGVDYNLCGTVIKRDFVEHIEHVRLTDTHILTLSTDTHVERDVVVAQNTGEDCLKLYKTTPTNYILLPIKDVEKVELIETAKITLTP